MIVQKPASGAVGNDESFLIAAYTRKYMFFVHITSPPPRALASQATEYGKTWKEYAPLALESSLPRFRVVGNLCLEVSLGTWEPAHFCAKRFRSEMTSCSVSRKNDTEMGQAPTSRARPRNLDHLRPSTRQRELYAQWSTHTPSVVTIGGL